jgi:type II secretion system protein J
MRACTKAFTLLELIMALAASAVLLTAVYGVFSRAVHLRDDATERAREARMRARAVAMIRNDLRHALISGQKDTALANVLEGSAEARGSSFPGYLKLTTTTWADPGVDDQNDYAPADVQQVEYYIVSDPNASGLKAGRLVRTVDQNLLATLRETPPENPLLTGIESMEVEFYDGSSWQTSWTISEDETTLPQAVRVRLQPAAKAAGEAKPAPIEVLVPWATQSFTETTTEGTGQ